MEYITDKTQVNELSQINIPKCYAGYVNTAVASSVKLLTMKEFITITGFEVDSKTFDILFMNINDEGVPIYINADMLNWMGYIGEENKQKQQLKELIQRNFEESDYKLLKNTEYKTFLKNETEELKLNFPEPVVGVSARSKKHLIVMPEAFRHLCMMINTNKGKYIKQYYTTLEKLVKAYFIYQCVFNKLCYKNELDALKNLPHIKLYTQNQDRIRLNEEIKNIGKIGYVYFIQEDISKNIKIGYTYNLKNRISELQIGNSQQLILLYVFESKTPYKLEKELHKKYKNFCLRGEWYNISELLRNS